MHSHSHRVARRCILADTSGGWRALKQARRAHDVLARLRLRAALAQKRPPVRHLRADQAGACAGVAAIRVVNAALLAVAAAGLAWLAHDRQAALELIPPEVLPARDGELLIGADLLSAAGRGRGADRAGGSRQGQRIMRVPHGPK